MNVKKAIKKIFLPPAHFFMNQNERYSKYEIGEGTYGNPTVRSGHEGTTLKIGRFCSIADGVTILLGGEHRVDWVTTYPVNLIFGIKRIAGLTRSKGDVIIGNDVWVGRDVLILSGVEIGDGAVIAARSVVTENVAPLCNSGGKSSFIN
jgi:acetyltransferase-like isoleucine patch superfamily enzyme